LIANSKGSCSVCLSAKGFVLNCSIAECKRPCHPICAAMLNFKFGLKRGKTRNYKKEFAFEMKCAKHCKNELDSWNFVSWLKEINPNIFVFENLSSNENEMMECQTLSPAENCLNENSDSERNPDSEENLRKCSVCNSGPSSEEILLECGCCHTFYHKSCTLLSDSSVCSGNRNCNEACILCGGNGGVTYQTSSGKFAHLQCSLFLNGVSFDEKNSVLVLPKFDVESCSECENRGCTLSCEECGVSCHINCGLNAGFKISYQASRRTRNKSRTFWKCYCPNHSNDEVEDSSVYIKRALQSFQQSIEESRENENDDVIFMNSTSADVIEINSDNEEVSEVAPIFRKKKKSENRAIDLRSPDLIDQENIRLERNKLSMQMKELCKERDKDKELHPFFNIKKSKGSDDAESKKTCDSKTAIQVDAQIFPRISHVGFVTSSEETLPSMLPRFDFGPSALEKLNLTLDDSFMYVLPAICTDSTVSIDHLISSRSTEKFQVKDIIDCIEKWKPSVFTHDYLANLFENLEKQFKDSHGTLWSDKFYPFCESALLGRHEQYQVILEWIDNWLNPSITRTKRNYLKENSSDDDFISDFSDESCEKLASSALLISGPTGVSSFLNWATFDVFFY
jgi:hypothetical protein